MNNTENQRVMLTKRLIKESLVRLLAAGSIYKLSIRQLCQEAGINRSTFYKYYGSQYDVLAEMETELLDHVQYALAGTSEEAARQIEIICTYLEANLQLVRLLMNNNADPDFPSKLFNLPLISRMLRGRLSGRYDEPDLGYVCTFVINGGYHLIREWISGDARKPAAEIAGLVLELVDKVCR